MDFDASEEMSGLGRGRSSSVFVTLNEHGERTAHKVFTPNPVAKLVFYVLDGAPNPYGWNEHAILTALARRRLVGRLVRYWFGDRLALPASYGWSWSEQDLAYEIRCEFIEGRHLPLRGPVGRPSDAWLQDLTENIMAPLQRHLADAGLDGLVWQAGRGNPVAASHFMLREPPHQPEGGPSRLQWVWTDLESGLPAILSNSLHDQLSFYLPRCWHYRRPLFDDTDVYRLRGYLEGRRSEIEKSLGESSVDELLATAEELEYHQTRWKSLKRHQRGIAAYLAGGHITDREAREFQAHPLRWHCKLLTDGVLRGGATLADRLRGAWRRLSQVDTRRALGECWRFLVSQGYRAQLSRLYVAQRIAAWEQRGSIGAPLRSVLQEELHRDESSTYIADFGVHLMIKPFMKVMQWWLFPALFLLGAIDEVALASVLLCGGAIGRTVYTLGRMVQAALNSQRLPWIALGLGALPVVGNAAYPVELVACSVGRARILARFILYDTFASLGRAVPVWGGADTLTEHRMNRLPDRMEEMWIEFRGWARRNSTSAGAGRGDSSK